MSLSWTSNIHFTRLSLAIHIATICYTTDVSQGTYVFQNSVAKILHKYLIYPMIATGLSPDIDY